MKPNILANNSNNNNDDNNKESNNINSVKKYKLF